MSQHELYLECKAHSGVTEEVYDRKCREVDRKGVEDGKAQVVHFPHELDEYLRFRYMKGWSRGNVRYIQDIEVPF